MGASIAIQGLPEITSMVRRHLPSLQNDMKFVVSILFLINFTWATALVIIVAMIMGLDYQKAATFFTALVTIVAMIMGLDYIKAATFDISLVGLGWMLVKHESQTMTAKPPTHAGGKEAIYITLDSGSYLLRGDDPAGEVEFKQDLHEDGMMTLEVAEGTWKGYWLGANTSGLCVWKFKREAADWSFDDTYMLNKTAGHYVGASSSDRKLYCDPEYPKCQLQLKEKNRGTFVLVGHMP